MCLLVIMPRSPISTNVSRPNRSLSVSTCGSNVLESLVEPEKMDSATGRPSSSVMRPQLICFLPRLPSRSYPYSARSQCSPSTYEELKSNRTRAPSVRCRFASFSSIRSFRPTSQSIALYTSFSLASTTSSSTGRVVACQARVVASLLLAFTTRYAINAVTRDRSLDGLDPNSFSIPKRFMAVSTALTWPSAVDAVTSNASDGATSVSPFNTRRSIRACSIDTDCVRFAIVRFRTRPSSRHVSRSKIAGRDERFGTMSTCMTQHSTPSHTPHAQGQTDTWVHMTQEKSLPTPHSPRQRRKNRVTTGQSTHGTSD